MLKIMALKVLKDIGLCLHKSPFYTIMADETTDKTNKEQVTLVLRWMDDSNFEVHEEIRSGVHYFGQYCFCRKGHLDLIEFITV